jgi:choline dehydrogenase-like flavoprotein
MTAADLVPVFADDDVLTAEVAVLGTGAGGSAVAGELRRLGIDVLMVEAGGAPHEFALGSHVRNAYPHEDQLQTRFGPRVLSRLEPYVGLGRPLAEFAGQQWIYAVGGMMSFWSHVCAVPDVSEREPSIDPVEMSALLTDAAVHLWSTASIGEKGVRQRALLAALTDAAGPLPDGRGVQGLPIGARVGEDHSIRFSGIDALLEADSAPSVRLLAEHAVVNLVRKDGRVVEAQAASPASSSTVRIRADFFVVAAGALETPLLLHSSGMRLPALGRYVTDHTMLSSRIRLSEAIVAATPDDDPIFGVWIPMSSERARHTQIVPGWTTGADHGVPSRWTADIGQFLPVDPDPENRLVFTDDRRDGRGLPLVDVEYRLSATDRERVYAAFEDHARIAQAIRDPRTGHSISLAAAGGSLHLMGTTRIGVDPETSVADSRSRVWGTDNLFVAGNGVVSTATGSNPTLNVVAIALRAARTIAHGR